MLLRLRLRARDEFSGASSRTGAVQSSVMDNQSELRQLLLDCLVLAPTVNLRQNEGLRASMEQLLRECKGDNKYEAAAKAQIVLDRFEASGVDAQADELESVELSVHLVTVGFDQCALDFGRRHGNAWM